MKSRLEAFSLFQTAKQTDALIKQYNAFVVKGFNYYHGENDFAKNVLCAEKYFCEAMLISELCVISHKSNQIVKVIDPQFFLKKIELEKIANGMIVTTDADVAHALRTNPVQLATVKQRLAEINKTWVSDPLANFPSLVELSIFKINEKQLYEGYGNQVVPMEIHDLITTNMQSTSVHL